MKSVPNLGQAIAAARTVNGWSQEALAEAAHVDARTIQRIEAGQPGAIESVGAIARAFGMNIDSLQQFRDLLAVEDRIQWIPSVRHADDLIPLLQGAEASSRIVEVDDPAIRVAAANLIALATDWADLGIDGEIYPDAQKSLDQSITELHNAGGLLFCYRHQQPTNFANPKLQGLTLDTIRYVVRGKSTSIVQTNGSGREVLMTIRQPGDDAPLRF